MHFSADLRRSPKALYSPEPTIAETATPTAELPPTKPPQPTAVPSFTPTVTHMLQPGEPSGVSSFLTDSSSADLASEQRSIADLFNIVSFERPFTEGRNGYDHQVFNAGQGADPDAAWVRRDPQDPQRVQMAFKISLLGPDQGFLWGVWADEGLGNPAWFDYNDHFTLQQAGSPLAESPEYPLKALAMVDSTCRSYCGFTPTGSEPGLCGLPTPPTQQPCQASTPEVTGYCVKAANGGCATGCLAECPVGAECLTCMKIFVCGGNDGD